MSQQRQSVGARMTVGSWVDEDDKALYGDIIHMYIYIYYNGKS